MNKEKNQNKSQEAYTLWKEHEPYVRKLCKYKLAKHPNYIDDCVQDVFIALIEAIEKGVEFKNPRAWITAVTVNISNDVLSSVSKESGQLIYLTDIPACDTPYYEDTYFDTENDITDENITLIKNAVINLLDEKEKQLLFERYEQKKDIPTLSHEYNTTENNIYQRLFRLRHKTKKLIKEELKKQNRQK